MAYASLEECVLDLERHGHLVRLSKEVDPNLEMAAIHLRMYEQGGPAILFDNIKGNRYRAASNLFGTLARSKFLFRETLHKVQRMIALRQDPQKALKQPWNYLQDGLTALTALPKKTNFNSAQWEKISLSQLPQIVHWPQDGGAFITLPQVYTEDVSKPGIMQSNLGMYRIQLSGNEYIPNQEAGLHYQLHRGIGVHQTIAQQKGQDFRISCFVGGPPAHSLSAVMPLPEGMSELLFAGLLGGRRFRYARHHGHVISQDADFVITGKVLTQANNKPEGPFGDHLGYYSLTHPFPVIQIEEVWAKKNAIWPFTVVGRPPQEDTSFGALIHEITGDVMPSEIPGLKEVHAVDAAGVHPLLLAVGSERYTPYAQDHRPAELLTIANRVLGTGQLSLAKFLFIAADAKQPLSCQNEQAFFEYVISRIDFKRDLHFYTKTSVDTLDYSGSGLNEGSKVVIAAYGEPLRELCAEVPSCIQELNGFGKATLVGKGIIALNAQAYQYHHHDYKDLNDQLSHQLEKLKGVALLVLVNDAEFVSQHFNNFLWVAFTRADPAKDIQGIQPAIVDKHWGCEGPLVIDARIKPHHAPVLEKDPAIEKRIDKLFQKNGPLAQWG